MTAPVRNGIELDAVGELHGCPLMKLPELALVLEPPSCLVVVYDGPFARVPEIMKLNRVSRLALSPASLPACQRQRDGIIQGSVR